MSTDSSGSAERNWREWEGLNIDLIGGERAPVRVENDLRVVRVRNGGRGRIGRRICTLRPLSFLPRWPECGCDGNGRRAAGNRRTAEGRKEGRNGNVSVPIGWTRSCRVTGGREGMTDRRSSATLWTGVGEMRMERNVV
uniref:Uncharacterized protein n=1 Tax=Odontella aurita TaxID=265563 RepID=A0A7S4JMA8_9STRA